MLEAIEVSLNKKNLVGLVRFRIGILHGLRVENSSGMVHHVATGSSDSVVGDSIALEKGTWTAAETGRDDASGTCEAALPRFHPRREPGSARAAETRTACASATSSSSAACHRQRKQAAAAAAAVVGAAEAA